MPLVCHFNQIKIFGTGTACCYIKRKDNPKRFRILPSTIGRIFSMDE